MLVFPALHVALPDSAHSQVVDHGPRLVGWVAEGSLDAAFVAIAGQIELPKGVASQVLGVDRIGVLVPSTCDLQSTDRRQLAGRTVVTYTTDYSGEELDGRVVALGATPYRAATAETAVRLGRLMGYPVLMPRSLLRTYLTDSDRELPAPRFGGPRLSLVTRVPAAPTGRALCPTSAGNWDCRSRLRPPDPRSSGAQGQAHGVRRSAYPMASHPLAEAASCQATAETSSTTPAWMWSIRARRPSPRVNFSGSRAVGDCVLGAVEEGGALVGGLVALVVGVERVDGVLDLRPQRPRRFGGLELHHHHHGVGQQLVGHLLEHGAAEVAGVSVEGAEPFAEVLPWLRRRSRLGDEDEDVATLQVLALPFLGAILRGCRYGRGACWSATPVTGPAGAAGRRGR